MAPESDEPGYSYLLEEDRPSRWRFLVTAIILFTLGGLAYWQISLHGGFSGTLNAFRNAQQQDQQRRADASHQAGPANDSDAKPSDESAATARKEAPTPGQAAPAGAAKAPPPDNQSTRAAVAPKEAAEPAATPSTQETSAAVPAKSAAEATQQASLRQSEPAAPAVDENTRLAEKYLYGEGVPQDCSRAVGLIKPAASSANPKAQSMLGTMYATGHCVPRDLPTSYRYFALALRQEPRNQWVEKDMEMVWNQMNPSEKQLATRLAK
jgi:TPR repeat protein